MSSVVTRESLVPAARPDQPIVNDFSIQIATANGSGSQSSNTILMRTIHQMGIPVSGKNLFPSNIQGLPTWFTIRASKHGYVARRRDVQVLVCMNPETAHEDVRTVAPGAAVVYEESLKLDATRKDLLFYPVPFSKLVLDLCSDGKLRRLVVNMIYVGVLGWLLGLDPAEIAEATGKQFTGKAKAVDLNVGAIYGGWKWAAENLQKRDPFWLERMDQTKGKIILDGNAAAAIGCMFAGVTCVTWYPITPSSSLVESLIDYMKEHRLDPETGKATFAIVQAEDELAAVGMVLGSAWAGARAMTATSGPGISLMSEFVGLGYYAEIPAVIFDIQRVGPSTGLPTRTMQGDILSTYYLSHGDKSHVLLFPASMTECYSMAIDAFDLAEKLQTPIFVMSDLDLGMNNWVSDPFPYPEKPISRGKVLDAAAVAERGGFARYRDVDGDGIPYRTLPGTDHPLAAYFTRGSGHTDRATYSERPEDYVAIMDRLARKHDTARSLVPEAETFGDGKSPVGILAFGSSHYGVMEARDILKAGGVEADYLRLRALPFPAEVLDWVRAHERVYVVEQNRDAQMKSLLTIELGADSGRLRSILHYNGLPLDAQTVVEGIELGEVKL
jgi:2-oxoglutarate ferredoxin oxidoreductase subunit alpha